MKYLLPKTWLRPFLSLSLGLLAVVPALAQVPTTGRAAAPAAIERAADGTPLLIRLPAGTGGTAAAANPQQVLRQQLALGPNDQMRPLRTEADALGMVHERFQQYYKGVKVEHGQYSAHLRNGVVESLSGELKRPAAGLVVRPALTEAAALTRALAAVGATRYKWQEPIEEADLRQRTGDARATYRPKGELVLVGDFRLPAATRPLVLAWKFNIYAQQPISRDLLYVDARTGEVVLRDAVIKHLTAPGTLTTRYVGVRTSTTDAFAGGFRLRETTRSKGITTLNCAQGTLFGTATDFVDNDNNWTAAEYNNAAQDNAALDAHIGAQTTQDYWVTQHGRDSYDNRGTVLLSYVHYDNGFENAFWDGNEMVYGDGNVRFSPLTAVDVCGHEIGHAVCQTTAGLVYQDESGALNEGFSDIWGACVENHLDPTKQIWLLGEDISLLSPSLRSMSDPNAEGQPDTYLGTNWYTGSFDHGGVHKNSGVFNFWFYLTSVGGTGSNDFGTSYSVAGITIQQAARIAYRAEQFYMPPSATYPVARTATMQAAADLYGFGSAQLRAVAQAWRAVGLGQAAPVVGSLSPASGPVGQVVTITGTNLSGVFAVSFNGTAAVAGTLLSPTLLQVVVPAGATTGPVVVTTPGGAGSSVGVFTVTSVGPAPTISSYAPAAGQRTGQPLLVTGTNLAGTTAVSIGGTAAVFVVNSTTQLTVTVPASASSGPLVVTTPGGSASVPLTVLPYLASFAPASGVVGTVVTLSGTSFLGALSVKFNGVYTAFTVTSATSITTTVPAGATTGPVAVRTPAGTATGATSFVVTPSLVVRSFTPVRGLAATTTVTVYGVGFTGATALRFNGVSAALNVVSDTEIWTTVPATATTGPISVTSPLGTAQSSTGFVVLIPGAPVINSFTPAYGTVGMTVTLSGDDFIGATAVRFNGVAALVFAVNNNNRLTATVPAGASTGPITVTNAVGTGQSTANFAVVVPPTNDLCTAANLPVLTCGATLTGTTLGASTAGDPTGTCVADITVGGVFYRFVGPGGPVTLSMCGPLTDYDSELFVFTGTCGNYTCVTGDDDGCGGFSAPSSVTFTSGNGTPYIVFVSGYATAQGNFSLTAICTGPAISSFTPASGPVGTAVALTGTNFTGATGVTFNGTAAVFTVVSATSITTTVPAGASTGLIRVVTPNGPAISATVFTVTAPAGPVLTAIPGSLAAFATLVGIPSAAQVLTVGGANLTATLTVTAPAGYAVALTAGGPYATSLTLAPTAGTVPLTALYVQLTGGAVGTFNGNLVVSSAAASSRLVSVAGIVRVPAPVLANLSPVSGPVGTVVTLTGTGFNGATQVSFNGTAAGPVGSSVTSIATTVPAGASTGPVTVTTPGGFSNGLVFTVTTPSATRAPAAGLALFPNPAHGTVTVQLPAALARWPLVVVDALGREVRRYPAATTALDLQGLPAGVYELRIGPTTSQKLVID